ncbi:hypothetical protein ES705_27184 [subsurface metagenome]
MNKEKLEPLVIIIDRGKEKGKPCPLETEELGKCPVYQKKRKEVLAKKPGEIKPLAMVFLDCQEKCPYAPTGKGGKSK